MVPMSTFARDGYLYLTAPVTLPASVGNYQLKAIDSDDASASPILFYLASALSTSRQLYWKGVWVKLLDHGLPPQRYTARSMFQHEHVSA